MLRKTVLNGLYFSGLDKLLSPLTRGIGSIWMLHRVNNAEFDSFAPNRHLCVTPEFLDFLLHYHKMTGTRFVSLDELTGLLETGEAFLSDNQIVSITLDDGYRDNLENAIPIFRKHSVPYAIYVAPGLVEGADYLWWEDLEHVVANQSKVSLKINGENLSLPCAALGEKKKAFSRIIREVLYAVNEDRQREMISELSRYYGHDDAAHVKREIMDWTMLGQVAADPLCTIGAHTMGHYALARLEETRAREEMALSRETLADKLGREIRHFAYPYGSRFAADEREFELARQLGFASACTTRHSVLYRRHKAMMCALPRISINGNYQSVRYSRTLQSGVTSKIQGMMNAIRAA